MYVERLTVNILAVVDSFLNNPILGFETTDNFEPSPNWIGPIWFSYRPLHCLQFYISFFFLTEI